MAAMGDGRESCLLAYSLPKASGTPDPHLKPAERHHVDMTLDSCIARIMGQRWLTILLSLVVIAVFTSGAPRLVAVDVDFRNHFSEDDPHLTNLDEFEDIYAISDTALIALAPRDGTIFTRETLVAVEELTEQLWRTPYVTRVDSLANYSHSEGVEDDLIVEPLVDDAGSLDDAAIERIEEIALGTEEVAGRLVSRDGRVAGFHVSFALPEERELPKVAVVDSLHATAAAARAANPDLEYHLTGELFLNRSVRDALDEDMGVLAPIALGVMLLVAVIMLRSVWGMIAIVVMIVTVILSSLGFAGWAGMRMYGESGAALFVMMAITVAHSVHIIEAVLAGLRQGMNRIEATVRALKINAWPVFLTSATTAIGFLSLNFSEMPPFQVMGNIVAFGALIAFVLSVTLLPAILSFMPMRMRPDGEGKGDMFDRFFDCFGRFIVSNHVVVLASFGALVVILIAGILRIELDDNHLELLNESYEFRQATDFVSENFTGLEPFEYSLGSGREGGITDVEYLRQVDDFAQWYREQPEVAHVFSIVNIMKRLNKNLNGDDPDFYRVPDSSDLAAQYLLLYEFSLPVGLDLNNLIDVERSSTRMTVVLKALSTNQKINLDNRAQAWLSRNAPGLETGATGVTIVGSYSIKRNIEKMLIGTVTAMAIVSLLLIFIFRSLRFGLISLIPNFVPAAMAMGLWGYVVGQIGVTAAVVTAIAFGIIVDDTIHFMTKYLRARQSGLPPSESVQSAFSTVGKALLATTVVFALGFLVFSASGMTNNQALGLLAGTTVIFALLADFFFLPPLLMILDSLGVRPRENGNAGEPGD